MYYEKLVKKSRPLVYTFVEPIFMIWAINPLKKATHDYGVKFQVLISSEYLSMKNIKRMHTPLLQRISRYLMEGFSYFWIMWASQARFKPFILFIKAQISYVDESRIVENFPNGPNH